MFFENNVCLAHSIRRDVYLIQYHFNWRIWWRTNKRLMIYVRKDGHYHLQTIHLTTNKYLENVKRIIRTWETTSLNCYLWRKLSENLQDKFMFHHLPGSPFYQWIHHVQVCYLQNPAPAQGTRTSCKKKINSSWYLDGYIVKSEKRCYWIEERKDRWLYHW